MYILEQLLFTIIFSFRLEKRKLSARRGLMLFGVLACLVGAQILITYPLRRPEMSRFVPDYASPAVVFSSFVICAGVFFLMVLLIRVVCAVSLAEAFYAGTCAYAGEHIAHCVRLLVSSIAGGSLADFPHPLYWIINLAVAVVCLYFFACPMISREHYSAPPTDTLRYLTVMILVILCLSVLATAYGFQLQHALYALVFCISILYYQTERQRALAREREASVREQLLVSQKAQYESYKENVDLVNRKCHDLKHQVAALRMLGAAEQHEAIREIEDSVLFYDSFVKTGNEGLDTILTQKNLLCAENKILFTCVADGGLISFMDPVDLFTLFGNMLDNAIEAVVKLPEERRSIHLTISEKLGVVLIREENPIAGDLKTEDGRIATTKSDRENHGFGIRSMELVAEKYDGSLACRLKEGVFILTVTLPAA